MDSSNDIDDLQDHWETVDGHLTDKGLSTEGRYRRLNNGFWSGTSTVFSFSPSGYLGFFTLF